MKPVVVVVQLVLCVLIFLVVSDGAPTGGDGASGSGGNFDRKSFEVATLEILFNDLDKDGEGKISQADVTNWLCRGGKPVTQIHKFVSRLHEDENGDVNFSDFVGAMAKELTGLVNEEKSERTFRACVSDNEEYVTEIDYKNFRNRFGGWRNDIERFYFKWMAGDRDRGLNIEEFKIFELLYRLTTRGICVNALIDEFSKP